MASTSGKLLIVDDEAELLEILSGFLRRKGLHVETASNGKEALKILRGSDIDAVLSDINMPEMNGLELLAYVRAIDMETPFVFLTGFGDKDNVVEALRLGATDFLDKPFQIEHVTEVVQKAVAFGQAVKQIDAEITTVYSQEDIPADKRIQLRKMRRAILMMRPLAKIYMDDK